MHKVFLSAIFALLNRGYPLGVQLGFTQLVEAKRRFIRLWRIPPIGIKDAAMRCPMECLPR